MSRIEQIITVILSQQAQHHIQRGIQRSWNARSIRNVSRSLRYST